MRLQDSPHSRNPIHIDAIRLLSRLDQKLNNPDSTAPALSSFDISKLSANLDYARRLLIQLENDATGVKSQPSRQRTHTDIAQQKQLVRSLDEKLDTLRSAIATKEVLDKEEVEEELEEENVPVQSFTTVEADADERSVKELRNASSSLEIEDKRSLDGATTTESVPQTLSTNMTNTQTSSLPSPPSPSSTLRSRSQIPSTTVQSSDTYSVGTTTATATSTSNPTSLFPSHLSSTSASATAPSLDDTLSEHRHSQDDLTASLLSMASQLKANSLLFAQSLEAEKPLLDEATRALDKNALGMEGAGRKMDTLEKSQGVSWFYKIKVFAALAALCLTGFLLLFVRPIGR